MDTGALLDTILKKKWNPSEIRKYVGSYEAAYLTYASDPGVRLGAASGGTVSGLLLRLLETGRIDGAVVCKAVIEEGKVRARFFVARSREEILEARGSKYVGTRFLAEVPALIRETKGRLAVVGLPCDLSGLKRKLSSDETLRGRGVFTIGLLCGHNSGQELVDHVTAGLEREAGSAIKAFDFRKGHWRGELSARFENGKEIRKPAHLFDDYQNLYFFCERKCLHCFDHYAYDCDIAAGDLWLYGLKKKSVKYTGIIVRTREGREALAESVAAGKIHAEEIPIETILDGQARTGPYHYNVTARHKAGKNLALPVRDRVREYVPWHHHLNAWLSLFAFQWSQHPRWKRFIFFIPRPLLKLTLWIKKAVECLK